MRRLALAIPTACVVLMCVALVESQAQTITPTSDYDLTATRIIEIVTGTARAIGTGVRTYPTDATWARIDATRTSIALTRDPSLAISPTPNAIQLTATSIEWDFVQLLINDHRSAEEIQNSINLTATAHVATEISASDPKQLVTHTPLPQCYPYLDSYHQQELIDQVRSALIEANIQIRFLEVITGGIRESPTCGGVFCPLRTYIFLEIKVTDVTSDDEIEDQMAAILSVLTRFPPTEDYGPEQSRLYVTFIDNFEAYRSIETGYANALAAYNEGLRGEALLEALGGILPG